MSTRTGSWRAALLLVALVISACGGGVGAASNDELTLQRAPDAAGPTAPTTTPSTASAAAPTTVAPPPPPVAAAPSTAPTTAPTTEITRPHPPRSLHSQAWVPYATTGPVTLHHPSDRVEAVGFHQSGHDGAQQQSAVAGAARWFTMESRDRDTGAHGAADIVVEPGREVRVPVTGTVIRAGTYTLYCDKVDQYAVIEPDARPGWEVKILHIEGLALTTGQRVEAGVTRLADRARVLPFPSQVEEDTALPPWPHVHVEVVDPSVPDRPTGPGCP